MTTQQIDKIIEFMQKLNPYPEEVFTEPTKVEYQMMKDALALMGLTPDKYFGSWGRKVWENCVNDMKDILTEILEDEIEVKP